MKVLNLLTSGDIGGIEILNYEIGKYSAVENAFAFLFGKGLTYERMKLSGFKVYDLTGYRQKISLSRYKELEKIARDYDIVTVHHGDPFLKAYYCAIIKRCKKIGVNYIHSCWDDTLFLGENIVKRYLRKWIFQKALDSAALVVFVSEAGRKSYVNSFKIKSRTEVIYNGIGLDKIESGKNNFVQRSTPINLLYVGRIEKIKGLDLLIDSLYELKSEFEFYLKIVGNGSHREVLKQKISSLHLESRIELVEETTDVKPYLSQSAIFVYPSICQEVFGIAIVEAMAYGMVCIANKVGGIPEVLKDCDNGFINETSDKNGMTSIIRKAFAILETTEFDRISARAKQTACSFSITNTCSNLDKTYQNLMGSHSAE